MGNPSRATELPAAGSKRRDYLIAGVALALTLALCVAVIFYWDYVSQAQQYGYVGAFVISVLAGGTVFVPIPGILVTFTLGSVLNPVIVGVVSGLGEAVGAVGIYLTGYGGRRALNWISTQIADKFTEWLVRRGSLAVFVMSAILNPLFLPFVAIAGMLRFGLIKFFFLTWAGKTVKNITIAYLGYFGLRSLLRLIGVGV